MVDPNRAALIRERKLRIVGQIAQLQAQLRRADDDLRAVEGQGDLESLIRERERVRPLRARGNSIRGLAENVPQIDSLVAERDQRDRHRTG